MLAQYDTTLDIQKGFFCSQVNPPCLEGVVSHISAHPRGWEWGELSLIAGFLPSPSQASGLRFELCTLEVRTPPLPTTPGSTLRVIREGVHPLGLSPSSKVATGD